MKRIFTLLFLLLAGTSVSFGATYTSDGSLSQTQGAINNVSADGDVVQILATPTPKNWGTGTLTINKNFSFKITGAGPPKGATTITFDNSTSGELINITMYLHKTVEISGLSFVPNAGVTYTGDIFHTDGNTIADSGNQLVIHHCSVEGLIDGECIKDFGAIYRTVHHCSFILASPYPGSEQLHVEAGGDVRMAGPDPVGSNILTTSIYEDCIIVNKFSFDIQDGASQIVWHSYARGCPFEGHGIDSGGNKRGVILGAYLNNIAQRVYPNGSTPTSGHFPFTFRGGARRVFHNYCFAGGFNYQTFGKVYHYRLGGPNHSANCPWTQADGRNPWDLNDRANHTNNVTGPPLEIGNGVNVTTTCTGGAGSDGSASLVPCIPSAPYGYVYAAGTYGGVAVDGAAGTQITLPLGSANQDCWKYYTLINIDIPHTNINENAATIFASTAAVGGNNILTLAYTGNAVDSSNQGGTDFYLHPGNHWQIRHVLRTIDGIANGHDQLAGGVPINRSNPGFPNQSNLGIYQWENAYVLNNVPETSMTQAKWNTLMGGTTGTSPTNAKVFLDETATGGSGNVSVCSTTNALAQTLEGRDLFNRIAPTDYNYDGTVTGGSSNPATRVGPDDDAVNFAFGLGPGVYPSGENWCPSFYIDGKAGPTYPSPMVTGGAGAGPRISNPASDPGSTSFAATSAADCSRGINCYVFAAQNFNTPIKWEVISGALPSGGVTPVTLDPNTGVLSGQPPGPAHRYTFTVRARYPVSGTITQQAQTVFNLDVTATNNPPVPTAPSLSPASGINTNTDVTISATASDSDGSITSIDIFDSVTPATSIATCTSTTTCSVTKKLTAGVHGFTTVAVDNGGASATSSATNVTVTSVTGPTPAKIIVLP